jgi:hypothetical protein
MLSLSVVLCLESCCNSNHVPALSLIVSSCPGLLVAKLLIHCLIVRRSKTLVYKFQVRCKTKFRHKMMSMLFICQPCPRSCSSFAVSLLVLALKRERERERERERDKTLKVADIDDFFFSLSFAPVMQSDRCQFSKEPLFVFTSSANYQRVFKGGRQQRPKVFRYISHIPSKKPSLERDPSCIDKQTILATHSH